MTPVDDVVRDLLLDTSIAIRLRGAELAARHELPGLDALVHQAIADALQDADPAVRARAADIALKHDAEPTPPDDGWLDGTEDPRWPGTTRVTTPDGVRITVFPFPGGKVPR